MPRKPSAEPRVKVTADLPFTLRQTLVARVEVEHSSITAFLEEAIRKLLADREVSR